MGTQNQTIAVRMIYEGFLKWWYTLKSSIVIGLSIINYPAIGVSPFMEKPKKKHMGVSENSVPLNPMVHDHYPYQMAIIGNILYFQTNPSCWG